MRCLVTGGAGFIGSHLVEALLEEGHEVVVLDNFSLNNRDNLKQVIKKIELIEGDINDETLLKQALSGVDCIFHYAAITSVHQSFINPSLIFQTNVVGTATLLQVARENNIKKIIFSSSAYVYDASKEVPQKETSELTPRSPYGYSKVLSEQLCQMHQKVFGMDITIFRLFSVYGSRQEQSSQYSGVIISFIERMLEKKSIMIYGDGHQTRDFIHISDVITANMLALKNNVSGVYNVGYGKSHHILQIAKILQSFVSQEVKMEFKTERRGDSRFSRADMSKIKQDLGFTPIISLRDGLQEVWNWAKKNKN